MANGNNTAKETVLIEIEILQAKLSNGQAGDPIIQGHALSLLISMVKPLFEADLQTVAGCKEQQKACSKNKFGLAHAITVISVAVMLVGVVLKLFG